MTLIHGKISIRMSVFFLTQIHVCIKNLPKKTGQMPNRPGRLASNTGKHWARSSS